jgi:hypothetical protein
MVECGTRSTWCMATSCGDRYATAETELLDWLITKPDGTEEGNVVGKFLDTYQP